MKKVELVNGSKVLKMDAKVFIIPNSLTKVSDQLLESVRKDVSENQSRICKLNELERFNPDTDPMVEVWLHSTSAGSDNLYCHGFGYEDIDGREVIARPNIGKLPVKLFSGMKEGDTFIFKVPVNDIMIEMELTLDQKNSRYRNFGTFEECLQSLVNNYIGS